MTGVNMGIFIVMLALFMAVTVGLGFFGYRHTKSDNQEFLLGRSKTNPLIIALSYGATFLSASAVIGFGGQAAVHGQSLMWLCFLNLFIGLFVAFIFFGTRTRRKGAKVGASTFADLLGKVFKSNKIRAITAIIIIVMMPIYCAAVLKGGVNSLATITGMQEYYNYILVALAIVVGVYVVYGGIIAVMYNDAFQAGIMFVGMAAILVVTFVTLGGITDANTQLADLWNSGLISSAGTLSGFNGWSDTASFGTPEWLTVVTTFFLGVGIGALTQPQLVVRFMSSNDDKSLNKSLIVGSIFMLVIVGSAYTVGPLSNVFFYNEHGMGSYAYLSSLGLGTDYIIPQFVLEIFKDVTFGDVFVCLFLLSLVCAAISTISALMHTIGVAGGYDLWSLIESRRSGKAHDSQSIQINRAVTVIVLVLVVVYCYLMPANIIAKATSLFMGMSACALLPAFVMALYCKRPRRDAALSSIAVGTVSYLFWALFINKGMSVFVPICKWITGNSVLFPDSLVTYVDPLLVALPLSVITMVAVWFIRKDAEDIPADEMPVKC